MAAFSTPFWMLTAGLVAVASGAAYLTRPQPGEHLDLHSSVQALAQSDNAAYMRPDAPTDEDLAPSGPSAPSSRATDDAPAAQARAGAPFTIDTLGRLVVTHHTLAVLDSWLPGAGLPLAALEPRLRADLPPLAATRAWALLQSHAAYRAAEREMLRQAQSSAARPSPREMLDRTMALRRRHFDSVSVQELFAMTEARAMYAHSAADILNDPTLSEAQQSQRLRALRDSLPAEVAALEFGGSQFSYALEKQVALMRTLGESDAEVLHLRRQYVDTPGAKSVIELEREQDEARRQAWELRHAGYVRQRDTLVYADMDVPEKNRQLEALLQRSFKPEEIASARPYSGL